MSVKVNEKVFRGLMLVKKSGATNMFDKNKVRAIAGLFDCLETVAWLDEVSSQEYATGILEGFEVAD